jgi:hypothetical protein
MSSVATWVAFVGFVGFVGFAGFCAGLVGFAFDFVATFLNVPARHLFPPRSVETRKCRGRNAVSALLGAGARDAAGGVRPP